MVTIGKSDIVREAAEKSGTTAKQAQAVIEAVLAAIGSHAGQGATVRFTGFGAFSVKARPARTGRLPGSGAAIEIPETRRLVFKASKGTAAT